MISALKSLRVVLVLATIVLGASVGAAHADWFTAKVEDTLARYVELFNAKDAAGLTELYSEDAKLMPPNSPIIEGREGIQKFWDGVFGMGEVALTLATSEAFNNGTLGYSVGTYTLSITPPEAEAIADEGKYVVVWKRGPSGKWELAVDIFNTDLAPPAAEAESEPGAAQPGATEGPAE
jgi:ketosteroid isomerase-like protein